MLNTAAAPFTQWTIGRVQDGHFVMWSEWENCVRDLADMGERQSDMLDMAMQSATLHPEEGVSREDWKLYVRTLTPSAPMVVC